MASHGASCSFELSEESWLLVGQQVLQSGYDFTNKIRRTEPNQLNSTTVWLLLVLSNLQLVCGYYGL